MRRILIEHARAKAVIHLFMHGGVSHVDTWDPKPELARRSGQTISGDLAKGLKTSRIDFNKALVRGSPWKFNRHGQSGMEISELYPHLATKADQIALIRSCHGDAFDHAPAMYLRGSGSRRPRQAGAGHLGDRGLRGLAELDGALNVVGGHQLADLLQESLRVHRSLAQEEDRPLDNDADGDHRAQEIDVHEETALLEKLCEVPHILLRGRTAGDLSLRIC